MRLLLVCLALLVPGIANALSCLRPDAVRLLEQAQASEATFYIVKGTVTFQEDPNLPERGTKTPTETRARIKGKAMTRAGFLAPFEQNVVIKTSCLGPWCGGLADLDGERIMSIEVAAPDMRVLNIGPCGGDTVSWDQAAEDRIMACFLENNCEIADF